jgi:hypothetical protein
MMQADRRRNAARLIATHQKMKLAVLPLNFSRFIWFFN